MFQGHPCLHPRQKGELLARVKICMCPSQPPHLPSQPFSFYCSPGANVITGAMGTDNMLLVDCCVDPGLARAVTLRVAAHDEHLPWSWSRRLLSSFGCCHFLVIGPSASSRPLLVVPREPLACCVTAPFMVVPPLHGPTAYAHSQRPTACFCTAPIYPPTAFPISSNRLCNH